MTPLDLRLYELMPRGDVLAAAGRMTLMEGLGVHHIVHLEPTGQLPAWSHFCAELTQVGEAVAGWRTGRVWLTINGWATEQLPLTWWDHATDLWTGMARFTSPDGSGWALTARRL